MANRGSETAAPGAQVSIHPPLVRFQDVRPGLVYRSTVTVRNTGTSGARMRLLGPASKLFRLWVRNPRAPVPAGLSLSGTVEFRAERDEDACDRLLLHCDEDIIEVPLLAFRPSCSLHIDLLVDFGTVVVKHQVISREVELTNQGSAPGVFSIVYRGKTPLSVVPESGTVAPKSSQMIKVELRADSPRRVSEQARVALQGRDSLVLQILAEMVEQVLELLDASGQEMLTCVRFGPAYFGTSRLEQVVLRNRGPEACDWVALLQDDALGTEMGTDLWRSTDAALLDRRGGTRVDAGDTSPVVTCVPCEGRLAPHESISLRVCFSPPGDSTCLGDEGGDGAATRKDFSLFLKFDIVGSRDTCTRLQPLGVSGCHGQGRSGSAELAVTGVGLPVSLVPHPGRTFAFRQCMMGQSIGLLCVLHNTCQLLPLAFRFRKTANFFICPARGHIPPGQSQEVVLTFTPHQMGRFRVRQVIEVLGQVAQLSPGPPRLRSLAFCHVVLHLSAICRGMTGHVRPPPGSGFPPAASRRTGAHYSPRTAVRRSCYGDAEEKDLQNRKYLNQHGPRRPRRREAREQREEEEDEEGRPAPGLRPPKVTLTDVWLAEAEASRAPPRGRLLSSCALAAMETRCTSRQVTEGMSIEPWTAQEVADCSLALSPQQLYLVAIGPPEVDFGQVCVGSASVRHLELSNSLQTHVWVQVEVCSPQLQRSGPLSHVLSPLSRASLPLVFESSELGPFRLPLSYTVNARHSGHVLLQGEVVPMALELSASDVELSRTQSGYRGVVTLRNRRNQAADFTWTPIPGDRGVAFSIRPAAGTVPPHRELDCELVWFPSFSAPQDGTFDLCVHQGNCARLHCVAKVGSTSVQLADKHLVFDGVPLNVLSVRRTVLRNTGRQPAYFQVCDVHPVEGMTVAPHEGVVPVGGDTDLELLFTPETVDKFDTRVEIALRNTRSLELRVGGSVSPPLVAFSETSLQFHGVYCGSRWAAPFTLQNRTAGRAVVRFCLLDHQEFSVETSRGGRPAWPEGDQAPHTYSVEMEGHEAVGCSLIFCPKEVAAHDFVLPTTLNGISAPSPPPSLVPKTLSASSRHIITPRTCSVSVATPCCRVQATVLRPPLDVSPSSVHFELQPSALKLDPQVLQLRNVSQEEVSWRFEITAAGLEDPEEQFGVSPLSGKLDPGQSVCVSVTFSPGPLAPGRLTFSTELLLFLFEEKIQPFRRLRLSAALLLPSVTFRPLRVLLPPVPLDTPARATVCLLPSGFSRSPSLRIQVEKVDLKDGSQLEPFSVLLPHGGAVPASGLVEPFICVVTFCSPSPLACTSLITFLDQENRSFQLQVCAVTDNCLLTLWPHVALCRSDPHDPPKSGHLSEECRWSQLTEEAGLRSGSFSSSTNEQLLSESWEGGAAEHLGRTSDWGASDGTSDRTGTLGLPCSPPGGSGEGLFFRSVRGATQRWFVQFGWPRGPNPVTIPHAVRRAVCKVRASGSRRTGCSPGPVQETRTVYDMVLHLCGQLPPGVGGGLWLPGSAPERVQQLHRRHGALLAFLSDQGASLSHVCPEHLMEPQDFRLWLSLQDQQDVLVTGSMKLDDVDFESLSSRVWTDVLLQTYKVFVLPRVTKSSWEGLQSCENEDHLPGPDFDPLARNMFSTWERRLLSWLNCSYQRMRLTVWDPEIYPGDPPPARWIVNFDLDLADGLVLAATVSAYCPFLIPTHFRRMYSGCGLDPEQNLHNALVVCRALRELRLPFHIQATEISDPNPVQLLMLCVHLYEKLPQYLPRQTVALLGSLNTTSAREVCVKNPSSKRLVYLVSIVGQEAPHFSLPHGPTVRIPPHGLAKVLVQVRNSFLRPLEAVLLLTSRPSSHPEGATLAFTLCSRVTHISPHGTVRCGGPCYELTDVQLRVSNPFSEDAEFRVLLLQCGENPLKAPGDAEAEDWNVDSIVSLTETPRDSQMDGTLEAPESNEAILLDPGTETGVVEFFTPVRCVWLKVGEMQHLELLHLPFHLGRMYCCVLLLSRQVGDLVYLVEATAGLPLPTPLSAEPSPNVMRTRAVAPAATGPPPLCFRCDAGAELQEVLQVPLVNRSWERALAVMGQQRMPPLERERRRRAGTLGGSSVRRGVAAQVDTSLPLQLFPWDNPPHRQVVHYTVESSMPDCFIFPECISLPVCRTARVSPWSDGPAEHPAGCQVCPLTLRFQPRGCGRYLCRVVLRSWRDVRVHSLEVVVCGEGGAALLEMSVAALSAVTQRIPLSNTSAEDWRLRVLLGGRGFHGPAEVRVAARETVFYPLIFKPMCECIVKGSLSLLNDTDGTEQTIALRGVAERSRAQDHVLIRCPVGRVTQSLVRVPNYTQKRVACKVVSDVSIISGPALVHIKPGKVISYTFGVSPWKRGTCRGVISFVAEQQEEDTDSAGGSREGDLIRPYEVWFSVELVCVPGEPVTLVPVQCAVQSSVAVEIPISNPQAQKLQLQVCVEGVGLTGDAQVCLPARSETSYLVTFSPTTVGRKMGSIIFQSELVGEFWYQLDMLVDSPKPTTVPECSCELGKWKFVFIPLVNNTEETLEMDVANSNPHNFRVLLDTKRPVAVAPHSTTQVAVQFYPSSLGPNCTACVSFTCTQLGEWKFLLLGRGEIPGVSEPLCLSTCPGSRTSVAVPFQNPSEHSALLHVHLTDNERSLRDPLSPAAESQQVASQAFSIPPQQTHGVPLAPQEALQIPLVFSPSSFQLSHCWLVLRLRRQDGRGWEGDAAGDADALQDRSSQGGQEGGVPELRWVLPLHGVPESVLKSSHPAEITCRARSRVEEHVEVLLTGCVPSSLAPPAVFTQTGSQQSATAAGEDGAALQDFLCHLSLDSEEHEAQLERRVSLSLLRHERDASSGVVSLTFSIAFAPNRPLRCAAVLAVCCRTGGLWKFPITLVATEPQVDDVISIEAVGLHKTAGVCFRLTGQSRHPEPFAATFAPGSGREFQVCPSSGELDPVGSAGTLFTVTFTPRVFNRRRRATLLVQTADMQWTYEVEGIPPLRPTSGRP